jgi:tetratricopeptide (TPR) repeat protein
MKHIIRLTFLTAIAAIAASPIFAQTTPATTAPAAGGSCDDNAKGVVYQRFAENLKKDQKVAFDAGKEFLQKCTDDASVAENVAYVKKFVDKYEKATRKVTLATDLEKKNYDAAFKTGKAILADEPDNLPILTALGWSGYQATTEGNNNFTGDAGVYGKKALQLIQSGKVPMGFDAQGKEVENWAPFKSKNEAVGYLNYALGYFAVKDKKYDEALTHFKTAAQQDNSFTKTEPSTYSNIAFIYTQDYTRLGDQYKKDFEGKEKTPESEAALARIDQVVDMMIDSYARAVAYNDKSAKPDPARKAEWMKTLTEIYKYRHNNSDAGLQEMINGITAKPVPTLGPAPVPVPVSTTTTTAPATGTPTTTAPATGSTPATTPATTPTTSQPTATQPTGTRPTTTTPPAGTRPTTTTTAPAGTTPKPRP